MAVRGTVPPTDDRFRQGGSMRSKPALVLCASTHRLTSPSSWDLKRTANLYPRMRSTAAPTVNSSPSPTLTILRALSPGWRSLDLLMSNRHHTSSTGTALLNAPPSTNVISAPSSTRPPPRYPDHHPTRRRSNLDSTSWGTTPNASDRPRLTHLRRRRATDPQPRRRAQAHTCLIECPRAHCMRRDIITGIPPITAES
jgi:hypothetical protein